ncbi:hypothetical protein [Couchioplanes caeruleus]|uniref:Uncharacterized protein n=1 Tax=Couchioplanes caeruleus TaxID=56438 RepID=A0A3N1GQF7_9ACTN|nr:hypothetical protein [Couchioplanes caeruleus]ROP32478.1 hypothetical protein EDD30_5420 [Couchioplanes caeruleus]
MLDPRHLELLRDCDRYLERQQVLLDRLAGEDLAGAVLAAMDSAFDQLLHAVTVAWRDAAVDLGDRRPDEETA